MRKLIEAVGGQAALARMAGVTQPAVHKWVAGKSQPGACHVIAISRATAGAVTPHQLRPDLYPDPDWLPPDVLAGRAGSTSNTKEVA